MKFTPEVVAALAVLREHAENDFERHRLDVLERDLTAPPVVEVIDDKHQKFNGITYAKKSNEHFLVGVGIQRAVWSYYRGEIPDGGEIHHIDENPSNNSIGNLQCITKAEHRRIHNELAETCQYICQWCGKTFTARKNNRTRFCSLKCYDASRYHSEHYQNERICAHCGEKFKVNKYQKTRFCSHTCAMKHRWGKI